MHFNELLLAGIVATLLAAASIIGLLLKRSQLYYSQPKLVHEIITRTNAWWVMTFIFVGAILLGMGSTLVLFAAISLLALREYITLIPTKRGDHRALFWSFLVICPVQYYLIGIKWYGMFSIFIPVWAFLFVPTRIVLSGECEQFLERAAKIQWGLMLCVYLVSYAPAILALDIPGYSGRNFELLFYLVFLTELGDVLQFVCGKSLGRRKVAPAVSPNKTWGGLIGGAAGCAGAGWLLAPFTPFTGPQSAALACSIVVTGFCGGLTMSAIKRDHKIKDYGDFIAGHGGILDRIDSLCFAAPVFFHFVRYYLT